MVPNINKNYLEYLENKKEEYETIGYARKSETNANVKTRILTSSSHDWKLKIICYEKIFVSSKSSSTKPTIERGYNKDKEIIISKLYECNGNKQGLLDYLSKTVNNVRPCIISYAGLLKTQTMWVVS